MGAARQHDQDAVRILARRRAEGLNQDGDEPSEEELATTEQFEHLLTVMNVHTNPRLEGEARQPAWIGLPSA